MTGPLNAEPDPAPAPQDRPAAPPLLSWKPFLVLLASLGLVFVLIASVEWSFQGAQASLAALEERNEAREAAETLLRRLIDAETSQRGFLLTGRETYLNPFTHADRDVAEALAGLKAHFRDLPHMLALVQSVAQASDIKLDELRQTLQWKREGRESEWQQVLMSDIGKNRMDAVRQALAALLDEAEQRAGAEQDKVLRSLQMGRVAVHLTALSGLLWLVFYFRRNAAHQRMQLQHARDIEAERNRLDGQVKLRTQELAELTLHLQTAQESHRARQARSLHDELGAVLTAAKLDVTRLRRVPDVLPAAVRLRLDHLAGLIDEGIGIKRRVIEDLMPSALHNLGLRPALEILGEEFRRSSGLALVLEVEEFSASGDGRNAVFQLVREALHNTERHARARQVLVRVSASAGEAVMLVRDDGVGFDPQALRGRPLSSTHGLGHVRHRIELAGGHFGIRSAPGQGTEINARVPL